METQTLLRKRDFHLRKSQSILVQDSGNHNSE